MTQLLNFLTRKKLFVKLLETNNEHQVIVPIFLYNNANANDIDETGQLFITTLYAAKCNETSLDKL